METAVFAKEQELASTRRSVQKLDRAAHFLDV